MKRSLLFLFAAPALIFFGLFTTSCSNTKEANAVEKITFSHKTHVEKYNIKDCGACHKYDSTQAFRGLPAIGDCTVCHDRNGKLTGEDHMTPRKKTMFDSYTDKDRPWISQAKDQQLLYYSHKVAWTAQLADGKTKLKCEQCHGDKALSTGTAKLKGGKLMEQCIECHTSFKMNNQCDVCHR